MFGSPKMMGASDYSERYLREIAVVCAFGAGAPDSFLMNYVAIGLVLAPKRGQEQSVSGDQYVVQFCCQMHTATRNSLMLIMASNLWLEFRSGLGVDRSF